ncbi:MAG TPA: dTDP-4-dehydrorhamnose reductase [Caulobacteraceae bacterium]
MSDILLTGGSGQVGTELRRLAPAHWTVAAPGRDALDLADPASVAAAATARPWAAVIDAGAYTAVDKAETETTLAWRVNAGGPAAFATALAGRDTPLLHVSTDYVFDGEKGGLYVEDDSIGPLGVYGASKAGGEIVLAGRPRTLTLRTAWVVSPHSANFVKTMLRAGAANSTLRVVDDQFGNPTSAADIAQALIALAERMIADRDAPGGLYHFVNAGGASRHAFAQAIFAMGAARGGPRPEVAAIKTPDYPLPARRPADTRLDTSKLTRTYGIVPRPWEDAVAEIVAALLA